MRAVKRALPSNGQAARAGGFFRRSRNNAGPRGPANAAPAPGNRNAKGRVYGLSGPDWRIVARTTVHRHEEANHEQGYGQKKGSEEEAGKVSAGKAGREAGEETEPRVSGLRCSRA